MNTKNITSFISLPVSTQIRHQIKCLHKSRSVTERKKINTGTKRRDKYLRQVPIRKFFW